MSKKHIVTFQLNEPGEKKYQDVEEAIKSFGGYCKLMHTVWIVIGSPSAQAICDRVGKVMTKNDEYAVFEITNADYCWLLYKETSDFLKKNL